jgi:SAM-dependent methyltransferase
MPGPRPPDAPPAASPGAPAQATVQRWFDRTYAAQGLSYLRPAEFYAIFMEYLAVRPGDRLLDVGCGPGLLLGEARRRGARGYGVDISRTALALARRHAPGAAALSANAEALPFRDGSFDHLTCIGTLEHFLGPERALAEMRRVLRPGGRACILLPNVRALKWQIDARVRHAHEPESHERAATLEEWRGLLARGGFAIERVERDEWPRRQRPLGPPGAPGASGPPAARRRHLLPLRYATQYVFLLRR